MMIDYSNAMQWIGGGDSRDNNSQIPHSSRVRDITTSSPKLVDQTYQYLIDGTVA